MNTLLLKKILKGGYDSRKKHLSLNLLFNFLNNAIVIIFSFVTVPIALNYWGKELYGVWTILISFSTYISISGLGIETSTGLLMIKNPNVNTKVRILKKGINLLFVSSGFAGLVLLILHQACPDWYKIIGKMSESNYPIAKDSAYIFVIGIILNIPLSVFSNALASFGKAYLNAAVSSVQTILNFVAIVLTIEFNKTLPFYVLVYSCITIFCGLVKLLLVSILIRKAKKDSEYTIENKSNDDSYKSIAKMGINLSLYGTALLIIPNISYLIISNNIDVESMVPYNFSYQLYVIVVGLVHNITVSASPLLGDEYGKGNWEWLVNAYNKLFTIYNSVSVFCILGVVWLGKPFITIWTKSITNFPGNGVAILLAVYFYIGLLSHLNHILINSFNYTSKIWLISWCDCLIFAASSYLLINKIGILSVPLGLCCSSTLVSLWAYPLTIYLRSKKRIYYDFSFLLKNTSILIISIVAYLAVSCFDFSFWTSLIIDVVGILITFGFLLLIFMKKIHFIGFNPENKNEE